MTDSPEAGGGGEGVEELVARLRAKRKTMPMLGSADTSGRSVIYDDGMRFANPDGPEAAALIERLASEKAAVEEPTTAMIDAGVTFALCVSLGGDYKWSDYVRDLFKNMAAAQLRAKAEEP